ncbi:MAG: hypothetical protein QHC79_25835 [Pseudosphingobacterium sp.]|nr:hypothetical protein [Pseudosphingobacterium sp.]
MIFCIALSALLAFAVLRPETKERKIKGAQLPLNAGMDGFTGTAIALSEVLRIHSEIEDILSADSLSLDDSIRLEKALKQFEAVQERLKQSHNSPPKIIDKPRQ